MGNERGNATPHRVLMVAGLGSLSAWRSTRTARRTVMTALVTGLLVGVIMWIGGMTAGGGFLT